MGLHLAIGLDGFHAGGFFQGLQGLLGQGRRNCRNQAIRLVNGPAESSNEIALSGTGRLGEADQNLNGTLGH
ncbi:MAG: hypothetical protein ACKO3P_23635, partial [Planctomycetaceae bacterium]